VYGCEGFGLRTAVVGEVVVAYSDRICSCGMDGEIGVGG